MAYSSTDLSFAAPERISADHPVVPANQGVRVVGDVHGDARAFAAAAGTDLFIVQLGDLTDNGPDSAEVLRIMFRLIDEGRGLFLLGNHDLKLGRALAGQDVRIDHALAATLAQLDPALRARARREILRAPAWLRHRLLDGRETLFVHAGFHTEMMIMDPPPAPAGRVHGVLARALYGEPTGHTQADGFPERSLRWVERVPHGLTVYCGHDCRSSDGRPYVRMNAAGGMAVFLDTGAGKGGHLSWIDLR
ncbi:MAG TPA: metallophosphoesterase [Acetobacteraceae bacterium]|jgi:protein phosphatase|nr:metallophosphoesterase [Acetobacteraceae bacterium]